MIVYDLEYLFTKGIVELEGVVDGKYFEVTNPRYYGSFKYPFTKESNIFENKESAIAQAEEYRIRELERLDYLIKKVSDLKFD